MQIILLLHQYSHPCIMIISEKELENSFPSPNYLFFCKHFYVPNVNGLLAVPEPPVIFTLLLRYKTGEAELLSKEVLLK